MSVSRRNGANLLDAEIAERARSKRYFDLCEERIDYTSLTDVRDAVIYFQLSKTSLEMAARDVGPSFVYQLYVHTSRLFQARNIVYAIVAHVKSNPFAPYINIIENTALDEGEWVLEANEKRVGSAP
jgi:hypothetical protein